MAEFVASVFGELFTRAEAPRSAWLTIALGLLVTAALWFGVLVVPEALAPFLGPVAVPGVDSAILDPRSTWADKEEYDRVAAKLVDLFVENFTEFAEHVEEGVRQAGPQVSAAA